MKRAALLLGLIVAASAEEALSFADHADEPKAVEGEYLVVMTAGAAASAHGHRRLAETGCDVKKSFDHGRIALVKGTEDQIEALSRDESVESVEPNYIAWALDTTSSWGLDRLDQADLPLDGDFDNSAGTGEGVRMYIIDTGVREDHVDFNGRMDKGRDFVDGSGGDCHGHGTHCASLAAGTTWGVAKRATIVPVRVLNCAGSGSYSDIIEAVDWSADDAARTGSKAVLSMSLGGPTSFALNRAIADVVNQRGAAVVAAAGNDATDACLSSPASEPSALTVGATQRDDSMSSFSNHGQCVDIYAPGSSIRGASTRCASCTVDLSGTSMACPLAAGMVALVWANGDSGMTGTEAMEATVGFGIQDKINGIPSSTVNLLVQTPFGDGSPPRPPTTPPPTVSQCPGAGTIVIDRAGEVVAVTDGPGNHGNNWDCSWDISLGSAAPPYLEVEFHGTFALESGYDRLRVVEVTADGEEVALYDREYLDGSDLPPTRTTSRGSSLRFEFSSDESLAFAGFSARVRAVFRTEDPDEFCGPFTAMGDDHRCHIDAAAIAASANELGTPLSVGEGGQIIVTTASPISAPTPTPTESPPTRSPTPFPTTSFPTLFPTPSPTDFSCAKFSVLRRRVGRRYSYYCRDSRCDVHTEFRRVGRRSVARRSCVLVTEAPTRAPTAPTPFSCDALTPRWRLSGRRQRVYSCPDERCGVVERRFGRQITRRCAEITARPTRAPTEFSCSNTEPRRVRDGRRFRYRCFDERCVLRAVRIGRRFSRSCVARPTGSPTDAPSPAPTPLPSAAPTTAAPTTAAPTTAAPTTAAPITAAPTTAAPTTAAPTTAAPTTAAPTTAAPTTAAPTTAAPTTAAPTTAAPTTTAPTTAAPTTAKPSFSPTTTPTTAPPSAAPTPAQVPTDSPSVSGDGSGSGSGSGPDDEYEYEEGSGSGSGSGDLEDDYTPPDDEYEEGSGSGSGSGDLEDDYTPPDDYEYFYEYEYYGESGAADGGAKQPERRRIRGRRKIDNNN